MFLPRRLSTILRIGCLLSLLVVATLIVLQFFAEAPLEENASKHAIKTTNNLYKNGANTPSLSEDALYVRLGTYESETENEEEEEEKNEEEYHAPPPTLTSHRFTSHAGSPTNPRRDPRVLLIVSRSQSKNGETIKEQLNRNRMLFILHNLSSPSRLVLTRYDSTRRSLASRFALLFFDHVTTYLKLDPLDKEFLLEFSRQYQVGHVFFATPTDSIIRLEEFQIALVPIATIRNVSVSAKASSHVRLTRASKDIPYTSDVKSKQWVKLMTRNRDYSPVLYGLSTMKRQKKPMKSSLVLLGIGKIRRFFFGFSDADFWLFHLLFLDALHFASSASIPVSSTRFLQIDIDDIFTGKTGIRLTPDDVGALIRTQSWIRQHISGFRFYLGFSSKFFRVGSSIENAGDDALLGNASEFLWFGHMPRHEQPHKYSRMNDLVMAMESNREFGVSRGLPLVPRYSVAPHHSGVYPVHEPLYEAWKRVYNVSVTSSYLHPNNKPAYKIRGFKYKGIQVLPRQICGVYTSVNTFEEYQGGLDALEESVQGGVVFQTLLNNKISIFMTHMSNYGSDRLANFMWRTLIRFVHRRTNIQLEFRPPAELAEIYFNDYPEDETPIWQPPCLNPLHKEIWNSNKPCNSLPNVLVVGPPNVGVPLLHNWLTFHPRVLSKTRKSTQFFTRHYMSGLDWYMTLFPNLETDYFIIDSFEIESADVDFLARVHALLPDAKIVFLFEDPIRFVLEHCKYSVLNRLFEMSEMPECLRMGLHANLIHVFMQKYSRDQILILDKDNFETNPVNSLAEIQTFLEIKEQFDYERILKLNKDTGRFCLVSNSTEVTCQSMTSWNNPNLDDALLEFLQSYFQSHNKRLAKILLESNQKLPRWLQKLNLND